MSSELLIHFLMFRKKNVHLYFFTVPFVVHREGDERSAWPGWVDILYWWVILSETFILFLVLVFLRKTVLLPCRPTICCLMSSRFVLREIYRQQSYSSFYYCEMLKKKTVLIFSFVLQWTVNMFWEIVHCPNSSFVCFTASSECIEKLFIMLLLHSVDVPWERDSIVCHTWRCFVQSVSCSTTLDCCSVYVKPDSQPLSHPASQPLPCLPPPPPPPLTIKPFTHPTLASQNKQHTS